MTKAFFLGLAASFFFAFTFVLNRAMQVSGGHWIWSASLRFFFMLPMLFVLLIPNRRYIAALRAIASAPLSWTLWSTVGFGFFYSCLCFASSYGPSWIVASTWQVTIIAGVLLTPLVGGGATGRGRIPKRQLFVAAVVFLGVLLAQARAGSKSLDAADLLRLFFIVVAAISYPLGNRMMMRVAPNGLGTVERVFGMTLCSMPFWVALSLSALAAGITPSPYQLFQTFNVALFSGIAATILFFKATEIVKRNARRLAVVESTQAGEVVFALIGGVLLSGDAMPTPLAFLGITIVIAGILLNGALARTDA
jgi:drug/metabolite transporter (DMT)-like permease